MSDAIRSGRADGAEFDRIRDMVRRYEGIDYSIEKAVGFSAACKERLTDLEESESRESLGSLADYVVGRIC